MQFTRLPDLSIAELTQCMDHADLYNLMLTSKRMYNVIKGFKKDKIHWKQLDFLEYGKPIALHPSGTNYKFNEWDNCSTKSSNIKKTLAACDTIDILTINKKVIINDDICDILISTKAKIGLLRILTTKNASLDDMFLLGTNFNAKFYFWREGSGTVINDKLLPRSTISKHWGCEERRYPGQPKPITDRSVDALASGNQKTFSIHAVHNSITIEGIVRAFKTHQQKYGTDGLRWDFGILRFDQMAAAEKYFGEDGKLRELCTSVSHAERGYSVIYQICGKDFYLVFAVVKGDWDSIPDESSDDSSNDSSDESSDESSIRL